MRTERDSEAELFKKIPDIDTFDAHKNATDTHVVITIRGIGEMEPKQMVTLATRSRLISIRNRTTNFRRAGRL